MIGSKEKKIGNITIACMSPEARDLLDELVEKFEAIHPFSIHDANGYQALYWACRYSGLIQPTKR